jgi:outer membrane immunogenic protein
MRFSLLTFAAGLAFATPALAQESVDAEPEGFSGIYVGAAGGYDVQSNDRNSRILFDRGANGSFGDTITTTTGANAFGAPVGGFCGGRAVAATSPTSPTAPAGCRNDEDGWAYYGRIGADTQSGGLVLGVVAEFGRSEINDSVTAFSTTPANYVLYRDVDWEASIRGRIGYTPNNTTLFYGTFGPGYAQIGRAYFSTNTANAATLSGDRRQFGVTGGGGIEQRIGRNFSIGLEYMHHRYQDDDFRVRLTQGTAPATNPFILGGAAGTDFRRSDTSFQWHSVRATAAFRF